MHHRAEKLSIHSFQMSWCQNSVEIQLRETNRLIYGDFVKMDFKEMYHYY
jgi:hypothetical protein